MAPIVLNPSPHRVLSFFRCAEPTRTMVQKELRITATHADTLLRQLWRADLIACEKKRWNLTPKGEEGLRLLGGVMQ